MLNNKGFEEKLVSLTDLISIIKNAKGKILLSVLIFALLGGVYSLTKSISYTAEATFREKVSTPQVSNLLTNAFLGGSFAPESTSDFTVMLKSRKFLKAVIEDLGLNASITTKNSQPSIIEKIFKNFLTEYTYLSNSLFPPFKDKEKDLDLIHVLYESSVPSRYDLRFISEEAFEISEGRKVVSKGVLNKPVSFNKISFVVKKLSNEKLTDKQYAISFLPTYKIVKNLIESLSFSNDKDSKNFIKLKLVYHDREKAAEIVNSLMIVYENFLREEQKLILSEQVNYLHKRQNEMGESLKDKMTTYALKLSTDAASSGFYDFARSAEFFSGMQQIYKKDLLNLDLEIKRLQAMKDKGSQKIGKINDKALAELIGKIRNYKQAFDSLNVALHENSKNKTDSSFNFNKQFDELAEVKDYAKETETILADVTKSDFSPEKYKLWNDQRYLLQNWCEKLATTENGDCLNQFVTYLQNLKHLFHVQEKTIEERLVHHQNLENEFQGIDLLTSNGLYFEYIKQVNEIEANRHKLAFVIEEMDHPNFEISSLSTLLSDPISQQMINKAGQSALQLKDQNNRTQKEQERLKEELALQKSFLSLHIKQTIDLLREHEKLLHEKINTLQKTRLALLQQEISVLEEQLASYVDVNIENLKLEKNVIFQHQSSIISELSKLPSKWVDEMLIDQEMKMNKSMVEELTKLVESKNISSNLEIIQSSPLDKALPPIFPNRPHTLLFAVLGGVLGSFISVGYLLFINLSFGLKASPQNLGIANQHVSGTFTNKYSGEFNSPFSDQDLGALRRLMSYMDVELPLYSEGVAKKLLLITNKGPDYSADVAGLMARMGLKVLLVSIDFNRIPTNEELPGLLQYLENDVSPKVANFKNYDMIYSGGVCRLAMEMLASNKFADLIDRYENQYDWILVISHSKPTSAEAEYLMKLFDRIAITVNGETLPEIENCVSVVESSGSKKKISFVFQEDHA